MGIGLIVNAISEACWGIGIVSVIAAISLAVQRSKSML